MRKRSSPVLKSNGVPKPVVEWHQPPAAAEWEWRTQTLPEFRYFRGFLIKWSLILGSLAIALVALVKPSDVWRVTIGLSLLGLTFLGIGNLELWMKRRCRFAYRVDATGFTRKPMHELPRLRWRTLNTLTIRDHPALPNYRMLVIKARSRSTAFEWVFDPAMVSERDLVAAITSHSEAQLTIGPTAWMDFELWVVQRDGPAAISG